MTETAVVAERIRVRSVERVEDGVVILFEDGRCAFYAEELLLAMMPQAEAMDEAAVAW